MVQTIFNDLGSNWKYVGPYWMFKKNAVAQQLYICFVRNLLLPMSLMNMNIKLMNMNMNMK